MKQSIQFDMLVKSENRIRGHAWGALHAQHKAQREKVASLLTQHIAMPPKVADGEMNQFVITLCRISAGFLDSEDNLTGAFKHVRDAVARWLGFRNDNDKRLVWRYQQQECPQKWYGVRITIEDMSSGGERESVVGKAPPTLGVISDGSTKKIEPKKPKQQARETACQPAAEAKQNGQRVLAFRRTFVAKPWDLPLDAAPDDIIATELAEFAGVADPPEQIQLLIPARAIDRMLRKYGTNVRGIGPGVGARLAFERVDHEDPAMGGKCWLYMPIE